VNTYRLHKQGKLRMICGCFRNTQTQAVARPDGSMQHCRWESVLAILAGGTVEAPISERSRDRIASFAISYILKLVIPRQQRHSLGLLIT
jgi:hypothetical protein